MAYLYRGTQSPRDEPQYSNFSNPLSPQRNPNRLSGGMMSSNDARGGLTRRFTMNALPTLSPIGQQRRQAAGEVQMVSPFPLARKHRTRHAGRQGREREVGRNGFGKTYGIEGIEERLVGSELRPVLLKAVGRGTVSNGAVVGIGHRRGKRCWEAIGDGRPNLAKDIESVRERERGICALSANGDLVVFWLTSGGKPTGTYSRVTPVSLLCLLHFPKLPGLPARQSASLLSDQIYWSQSPPSALTCTIYWFE